MTSTCSAGSSGDDTIAWYENTDGLGSFGPEQVITATADGAWSVFAADVDGDGDLDVLSASQLDDKIAWYENTDGLGSFGPEQVIATTADFARSVCAADVDGDGDLDVLSASFLGDKIAWYENTNGQGSFGPEQVITATADGASSVFAADVDGDGDLDALSASYLDHTIAWYENRSGQSVIATASTSPGFPYPFEGEQAELLRVDVSHLGRAGDADEEIDTLELSFDRAPATPLSSDPAAPLTSAEANALIDNLDVYRDDGSGVFESGMDALVATVASLSLTKGIQTIDFPDADSDVQIDAGATARFFVVADLSATGSTAVPNAFRVRHLSSHSEIIHAGTDIVLAQAPGTGTQPRVVTIPEPAFVLQLAAGVAFLAALTRRRTRS